MLSLALPGKSWAHRRPAGAKFGVLAVLMGGASFVHEPVALAAGCLGVAALYLSLGRRACVAGLRSLRPLLWILAIVALWQVWQGAIREGIVLVLRIVLMVGLANFVTLTTPLPELIALVERLSAPLARFGLDPRLPALAIGMVLRFVPVLRGRVEMLSLAWRARARRRPGPRLLVPLTLSLLDDSDHLAEALRARGGLTPARPNRRH